MDSFTGKAVLITGASEGIGAALCRLLQKRGAKVSLVARNADALRHVGGPEAVVTAGDLTDEQVRREAVDRTVAAFGRLDAVLNNAGRGLYFKASDTPMDEARALLELNFFAPAALAQYSIPHLKKSRGVIVNISSIAGQMPLPWLPFYSASKSALASLTASQRMELKKDGIHSMCVYPGYVKTAFQDHAIGPRPPQVVSAGKRYAVTAEQCAAAVLRGMERRAATVVVPRIGWAAVWLYRLFPGIVESRMEMV